MSLYLVRKPKFRMYKKMYITLTVPLVMIQLRKVPYGTDFITLTLKKEISNIPSKRNFRKRFKATNDRIRNSMFNVAKLSIKLKHFSVCGKGWQHRSFFIFTCKQTSEGCYVIVKLFYADLKNHKFFHCTKFVGQRTFQFGLENFFLAVSFCICPFTLAFYL
jgi:hypothetical protein